MGLSNNERRSGIFWSIRRIIENSRELPEETSYENKLAYQKIKELAEELWPAYLGNQSNSIHWLAGSSASNVVSGKNNTPWDMSVAVHIENALSTGEDPFHNDEFDPFKGYLDIEGLLVAPFQKVYRIFAWTEQLTYYLRRYDDAFLKNFSWLSNLCAKIQGECFTVFVEEEGYARAYLGNAIAEILYHRLWPKEKRDTVTVFLREDNIHHYIGSAIREGDLNLARLIQMHSALMRTRFEDRSLQCNQLRRMLFALELAGHHFFYKHQHDKLRKCLKEAKWKKKDLREVEKILENHCQEKKHETRDDDYIDALFYSDNPKYEKAK